MAKIRFKDSSIKYEQILSALKRREYKPVYLLMGEEPLYIDALSDYIAENVLAIHERAFNQLMLYGKDTDIRSIVFAASRPPMMAEHQVVIVKEAQSLKLDSNEQLAMENYVKNALSSTILVFCFRGKTLDKRTKLYKEIENRGAILETAKLYDSDIPGWISSYLTQKGAKIETAAAAILSEHIGNDLNRIIGELDKLFILLPENNKTVTVADIEKNIGISKEYNIFEFGSAVLAKNVLKANRIIGFFGKNMNAYPMVLIIPSLFSQFIRLLKYHIIKRGNKAAQPRDFVSALGVDPFFLREYESASTRYSLAKVVQVIELLREYDMKSKGWNGSCTPQEELLRELTFKIMH